MPTLEEELIELEKQEEENSKRFSRFRYIENLKKVIEGLVFIFSVAIVVSVATLLRIWYKDGLPITSDDYFIIGFLSFYPGAFAVMGLMMWLSSVAEEFLSRRYLTAGPEWAKTKTEIENISTKKAILKKQIQFREEQKESAVDRRKKERHEERNFLFKLNSLVYKVLSQDISYEEANTLAEQLWEENRTFRLRGYLLFDKRFYDERFAKIDECIKRYTLLSPPEQIPSGNNASSISAQKNSEGKESRPTKIEKPGKGEISKADTPISNSTTNSSEKKHTAPNENIAKIKNADSGKQNGQSGGTSGGKTHIPTEKKSATTIEEEVNNTVSVKTEKTFEQKPAPDQINFIEDIQIFELLATPPEKSTRKEYKKPKSPIKPDYLKLQEHRQNIGELGEEFAIAWEKSRLTNKGLYRYRNNIVHTSKTDDSAGYDFISYFDDGRPKYVEVKTTVGDFLTPFYLTETEVNAIKQLDNYFIYRIFDFDISSGVGEIFTIRKEDIKEYFELEPTAYRVSPKR